MEHKRLVEKDPQLKKDDLIVITGAGGFIAGNLALYFKRKGFTRIRAVDKKPLYEWYLKVPGVESLCLDVSDEENCKRVCEGAVEVYQLAADMGGMGFHRAVPRRMPAQHPHQHPHDRGRLSRGGPQLFFFLVGLRLQHPAAAGPEGARAEGIRRLPGDGRARLRLGEADLGNVLPGILGRARHEDAIARFHNVYGPNGTWDGGREKAPAAICRKVIEAIDQQDMNITIWGDGTPTRSFMYIDDCVKGIDMIMHCDDLIATPINLGSSELVSINELLSKVEKIAGVKLKREYDLNAPRGVAGRNSDNTFIKKMLKWEPNTPLDKGLAATYKWIKEQYHNRKKGKRVVE